MERSSDLHCIPEFTINGVGNEAWRWVYLRRGLRNMVGNGVAVKTANDYPRIQCGARSLCLLYSIVCPMRMTILACPNITSDMIYVPLHPLFLLCPP